VGSHFNEAPSEPVALAPPRYAPRRMAFTTTGRGGGVGTHRRDGSGCSRALTLPQGDWYRLGSSQGTPPRQGRPHALWWRGLEARGLQLHGSEVSGRGPHGAACGGWKGSAASRAGLGVRLDLGRGCEDGTVRAIRKTPPTGCASISNSRSGTLGKRSTLLERSSETWKATRDTGTGWVKAGYIPICVFGRAFVADVVCCRTRPPAPLLPSQIL
jgi:hypothetical protein